MELSLAARQDQPELQLFRPDPEPFTTRHFALESLAA